MHYNDFHALFDDCASCIVIRFMLYSIFAHLALQYNYYASITCCYVLFFSLTYIHVVEFNVDAFLSKCVVSLKPLFNASRNISVPFQGDVVQQTRTRFGTKERKNCSTSWKVSVIKKHDCIYSTPHQS